MKLSQLVAQATARLHDLQDKGIDDAECFVSLKGDERDVHDTKLFLGVREPRKWFFEIKTEKDEPE